MKQPDWQIDNFKQMKMMRWILGGAGLILAFSLLYNGFNDSGYTTIVILGYGLGMVSFGVFKPKLIRVKFEEDNLKIFLEDLFTGKVKSKTIPLQSVQSIKFKNLNDPFKVEAVIENRTENDFVEDTVLPIKFLSYKKREELVDKLRDLREPLRS